MIGLESYTFNRSKPSVIDVFAIAKKIGFRHVAYYTDQLVNMSDKELCELFFLVKDNDIILSVTLPKIGHPQLVNVNDYECHFKAGQKVGASIARVYVAELAERPESGYKDIAIYLLRVITSIVKSASKYGLVIALENHGDLPLDILRYLKSSIPELRFCFDFGNQFALSENPLECWHTLKDSVVMVHLKDIAWRLQEKEMVYWRAVPLGFGGLPLNEMIANALSIIPTSHIVLELSTSGGLRSSPLYKKSAFSKFAIKYEHYEDSYDSFASRKSANLNTLQIQEKEHFQISVKWLIHASLLPSNKEGPNDRSSS